MGIQRHEINIRSAYLPFPSQTPGILGNLEKFLGFQKLHGTGLKLFNIKCITKEALQKYCFSSFVFLQ